MHFYDRILRSAVTDQRSGLLKMIGFPGGVKNKKLRPAGAQAEICLKSMIWASQNDQFSSGDCAGKTAVCNPQVNGCAGKTTMRLPKVSKRPR